MTLWRISGVCSLVCLALFVVARFRWPHLDMQVASAAGATIFSMLGIATLLAHRRKAHAGTGARLVAELVADGLYGVVFGLNIFLVVMPLNIGTGRAIFTATVAAFAFLAAVDPMSIRPARSDIASIPPIGGASWDRIAGRLVLAALPVAIFVAADCLALRETFRHAHGEAPQLFYAALVMMLFFYLGLPLAVLAGIFAFWPQAKRAPRSAAPAPRKPRWPPVLPLACGLVTGTAAIWSWYVPSTWETQVALPPLPPGHPAGLYGAVMGTPNSFSIEFYLAVFILGLTAATSVGFFAEWIRRKHGGCVPRPSSADG